MIPVYIRRSDMNEVLEKVGDLTQERNLIYNDEGHCATICKFTLLTAASPLLGIARLVRAAVFLVGECDAERAGREFIGGLAQPFITGYCLAGSLLSAILPREISFYVSMRRTYAYFEAWVNDIDLKNRNLTSYSHRVSDALDMGNRIWTTAPCMQPLLERAYSRQGGLLDGERMKRIFPFLPVDDVQMENGEVVLQSHYIDREIHVTMCNDTCEHKSQEKTCCCCYRVEAVYDRCLCTEVGQGRCTSMINPGNSCGIVLCNTCGVGGCCCYLQEDYQVKLVNAGCFGPQGPSCLITVEN